jgi:hypothetical protein
MSWTSQEAQQIGRIEAKLSSIEDVEMEIHRRIESKMDTLANLVASEVEDLGERVGSLERFRSYAKGVSGTVIGIVGTVGSAISYYLTRAAS